MEDQKYMGYCWKEEPVGVPHGKYYGETCPTCDKEPKVAPEATVAKAKAPPAKSKIDTD